MNMKQKHSHFLYIIAFGLLSLILLTFNYLKATGINKMKEEIETHKQYLINNQIQFMQLQALLKKENEFNESLRKIDDLIPQESGQTALMNEIDNMITSASLELLQVQFSEKMASGNAGIIPFTLIATGKYYDVLKCLNEMENGRRLFRIDEININKNQGSDKDITVNIKARTFFR